MRSFLVAAALLVGTLSALPAPAQAAAYGQADLAVTFLELVPVSDPQEPVHSAAGLLWEARGAFTNLGPDRSVGGSLDLWIRGATEGRGDLASFQANVDPGDNASFAFRFFSGGYIGDVVVGASLHTLGTTDPDGSNDRLSVAHSFLAGGTGQGVAVGYGAGAGSRNCTFMWPPPAGIPVSRCHLVYVDEDRAEVYVQFMFAWFGASVQETPEGHKVCLDGRVVGKPCHAVPG